MKLQREIDIDIKKINDVSVVKLGNMIDFYNAPVFKTIINSLIDEDKKSVIINLAKINHIDSSGIGALITSMIDFKKAGGSLKICSVNKPVMRIFEMTKAETLFEIYESEADALNSFKK